MYNRNINRDVCIYIYYMHIVHILYIKGMSMCNYASKIIKVGEDDDIDYLMRAMFNRTIYEVGNGMKCYLSSNFKKKYDMI